MENRKEIFEAYKKFNPQMGEYMQGNLLHSFVGYDRYFEAKFVNEGIKEKGRALDFGCGVGDYGFYLLRNGWAVDFYDYLCIIDFIKFRLSEEKLTGGTFTVETGWQKLPLSEYKLIVFGEVLEHIENPTEILTKCLEAKIKYILTSSYPYKSADEYGIKRKGYRGHLQEAYKQQGACQKLLENNYTKKNFGGQLNLWTII